RQRPPRDGGGSAGASPTGAGVGGRSRPGVGGGTGPGVGGGTMAARAGRYATSRRQRPAGAAARARRARRRGRRRTARRGRRARPAERAGPAESAGPAGEAEEAGTGGGSPVGPDVIGSGSLRERAVVLLQGLGRAGRVGLPVDELLQRGTGGVGEGGGRVVEV